MPATQITSGVARLPIAIVNTYFLGVPGGAWILVDTGLPGFAGTIKAAAADLYGEGARPEAIVLTHGHFDHVGNAKALAEAWDVPVYAHSLEMPYLNGQSDYPPLDPTVGGFMPFLSRTFPASGHDLRPRLRELPSGGVVPGAPGWVWHFTPGHAPGHVSLLRASDKTLVAGDALITVNMDTFRGMTSQHEELSRPPSYGTCDWAAARQSVELLASLNPRLIAAGHGTPMTDADMPAQLRAFAYDFMPPAHGRYIPTPAHTDSRGVVDVPPPAPDPVGIGLAVGAAALGAGLLWRRRQRKA